MDQKVTQETLNLIKMAQQNPSSDLAKAWVQAGSAVSGITAYDLEPVAKQLYPVITPLRNTIPRTSGKGGIQANWRGITGINTNSLSAGVGQGNRGGVIATTTQDYIAAYRSLGLEDNVTFEADLAAMGFDDVKALAVEGLLRSMMIQEERIILGGNSSNALGTTPTPTLSTATTGGTIANAAAFSVICVALTHEGFLNSSVAGGIPAAISRTNADSSVDSYGGGSAQKSANATIATTGSGTSTVTATVAAVRGAVAYAWFTGATAGTETLSAITTINSVTFTAAATGTQTAASLPSSDNSKNTLIFDGLMNFAFVAANNAYFASQPTGTGGIGTPLTSDGAGGIVELDVMLKSFWDNFRLSPSVLFMNSQELLNIGKKILAGSSNAAQRFVFNAEQGVIAGGTMVRSYLNKFSMNGAVEIPIMLHPNMPPGTILAHTEKLPYPLSNVTNVAQIRARRDYYQIEWPLRSRKYEYGIYADEVLQHYFPPSLGVITNIANG
jgi:hypothetical protein